MPSPSNLREWYGFTTGSCRIPLFDYSRLHVLDVSARNYRTETEYYIHVFFRHRWYHGNYNRAELTLVQAWNSFISTIENVGSDAWLSKDNAARNRFKQKSMTGAWDKLHRLSRKAGLLAFRGERTARVVLTTRFAPLRRPSSTIRSIGERASHSRCTKKLRLCNPFTNTPGVRSTMALHR